MNRSFEISINNKMLYYDYVFPTKEVFDYVEEISSIEIPLIIDYIRKLPAPCISSQDVFQFSNFNDATLRLCERLKEVENPGLKHPDLGRLLLNDGILRKEGAYAKYGENHGKTGVSFGLVFELSKTYFLSCIGFVYPDLDEKMRMRLLTRLILRCQFIERVICASFNGKIQMRQFLYMLSDSTYQRRRSNIKTVINELCKSSEFDFSWLKDNLVFL